MGACLHYLPPKALALLADEADRMLVMTDPEGKSTGYGYDDLSRLITTTHALSTTAALQEIRSYDEMGRLASVKDIGGNTTVYSYDFSGRLTSVGKPIDFSGGITSTTAYQYDRYGNLKTITDAEGKPTTMSYDLVGRLTGKLWADNTTFESYNYTFANLGGPGLDTSKVCHVLPYNKNTPPSSKPENCQHFNGRGWLVKAIFLANQVTPERTVDYTYNDTGARLTAKDDSRGTTPVSYELDRADRVTKITQPGNQNVAYGYNTVGNRTLMTATVGSDVRTVSYGYDLVNRLETVNTSGYSRNAKFFYDYAGKRTKFELPNNTEAQYGYDDLNRQTSINYHVSGNSSPFASFVYQYNGEGWNKTQLSENIQGITATVKWYYDDMYRLKREERLVGSGGLAWDMGYTYDKVGNRLTMTSTSTTSQYQYNSLDQLTVMTQTGGIVTNYAYNIRGNLQTVTQGSTTTTYGWDATDRLISAATGGNTLSFNYDHANRRVKQTANSTITNFLWDELSTFGDVVIEGSSTWNVDNYFVLAGNELVSQNKSSTVSYFVRDGQGSTRALTNGSSSVTQSYIYEAFGKLQSPTGSLDTNYLYTGQQFDGLTGLYSLRARYYNPSEGRFVSRDTWRINQYNPIELNRYGYTANNPANGSDPTGYNAFWDYVTTNKELIFKNLLYATATIALSAFIVTAITAIQVGIVLAGARTECLANKSNNPYSDSKTCIFYLSPEQTKQMGQLLKSYSDNFSLISTILGVPAFVLSVVPFFPGSVFFGVATGIVGFIFGNNSNRLRDMGNEILTIYSNGNKNDGKIKLIITEVTTFSYEKY
jgi:RHS repeat-associated protein